MELYDLYIRSTILALVLIFLGSWFMNFASKAMRSNDLVNYRKALRVNAYSISIFWAIWVCHAVWPGIPLFNRAIGALVAEAISLRLVLRLVSDVTLTKKVVIWFVWSALLICIIIVAVSWGLI